MDPELIERLRRKTQAQKLKNKKFINNVTQEEDPGIFEKLKNGVVSGAGLLKQLYNVLDSQKYYNIQGLR